MVLKEAPRTPTPGSNSLTIPSINNMSMNDKLKAWREKVKMDKENRSNNSKSSIKSESKPRPKTPLPKHGMSLPKKTTFAYKSANREMERRKAASSTPSSSSSSKVSGLAGFSQLKNLSIKASESTKKKQPKSLSAAPRSLSSTFSKAKSTPSPAPPPAATSTTNSSIESMVKKSVSAILKDISSLKTQTSPGQKRVISIGQKIHLNKVQATLSLATEHGFSIPSPTSKDTLISLPLGWPRNPFSSDSEGNGKIKDGDLVPYLEYCDTLEVVESGDMSTSSNNSTSSNSSCTTASAVTAATTPTSNKSVKVWRCDKCKEVSFDTFEKAEKHEKTCGV